MEWALLNGDPNGISVFFIDTGIDTGKQVALHKEISLNGKGDLDKAKKYLFSLDAELFREALLLIKDENFSYLINDGSGKRYFVMSKLLLNVTNDILVQENDYEK